MKIGENLFKTIIFGVLIDRKANFINNNQLPIVDWTISTVLCSIKQLEPCQIGNQVLSTSYVVVVVVVAAAAVAVAIVVVVDVKARFFFHRAFKLS